jgi:hypothetical protein
MADMNPWRPLGAVLAIVIAVVLVAALFGSLGNIVKESTEVNVELVGNTGTLPDDAREANTLEFRQTLGTAFRFDGTAGVSGSVDLELDEHEAAVCTFARPLASANGTNMTVLTWDGDYTLQYHGNRTTPSWVGLYTNESAVTTADVVVEANETDTLTLLCLERENDTLRLTANATREATQSLANETEHDTAIYGLDDFTGDVEETRVFNRTVATAEESELLVNATYALDDPADVRVMYDVRDDSPSSVPIFLDGAPGPSSATVSGVAVVDGFPELNLTVGTDYTLSSGTVTALVGGAIDGAPVVYVDGPPEFRGPFLGLLEQVRDISIPVLAILAILLLAVAGRFVNSQM